MIRFYGVGGYEEVGKNMSALEVDGHVVILDMGWDLEEVLANFPDYDPKKISEKDLKNVGAIPDDRKISHLKDKVDAIVLSHAHLDHIAAAPKLARKYDAPIIATPFTIEVLKQNAEEEPFEIKNRLIPLNLNDSYDLGPFEIEFVYATHSTVQVAIVVIHTDKGLVVYGNDYKFDRTPVIGQQTNIQRLRELGKEGVLAFISDAVRIERSGRSHSESVAREMLKDVVYEIAGDKRGMILTTFASHIQRLKSMIDIAHSIGRKPVLIGRSMRNYVYAAKQAGIIDLTQEAEVIGTGHATNNKMEQIKNEGRENYAIITTGHQGEPYSGLDRMSRDQLPLKIQDEDKVIFSSETIPTPTCKANKSKLKQRLRKRGARLYLDIHVTGHCCLEDKRESLKLLNPKHFIPCHAGVDKLSKAADMAIGLGYELGETVHVLQNGQSVTLK